MRLGLSPRELRTVLLGGVIGIAVLYMYVAMILTPLWREASSLGERVSSARTQLAALRQATTNEAAIQEQHHSLQGAVVSLRGQLPSEDELPAMTELLFWLPIPHQHKK